MKIKMILLAAAAMAAVPAGAGAAETITTLPANYGQTLLFWFISADRTENVKFTLDTYGGPFSWSSRQTTFNDVMVEYAGGSVKANISFWSDEIGGGFGVIYRDNSDALTMTSTRDGKALFSGPTSAPVFSHADYGNGHSLEGIGGYQNGYLMILDLGPRSEPDPRPLTPAVPEPATWAMMLVGFGMVAGAARYRRRSVYVALA